MSGHGTPQPSSLFPARRPSVLWLSPRPNSNGRYWRILSNGHVERAPRGWKP